MPATLGACAMLATSGHAEALATYAQALATVKPSFSRDRLGATGALRLEIQLGEPGGGVPAPVRRSILRFPAGLTLEVPHLRSCSASRLRASGANGCPAASMLGRGQALVQAQVGSQTITENVSLWLFLGPLRNIQPTVVVLGQGYTPFYERVVLIGTMLAAGGSYGEALTLSIPPIPTLPLEPDASIVALSLTIGAAEQGKAHQANTVKLPSSCPPGGFPFAAEFAYADGSSASSYATMPCP